VSASGCGSGVLAHTGRGRALAPDVAYTSRGVDYLLGALAQNLRRYRSLRGFSSSEVAQRSQIARATLSALEAGRGNPTLDTLSAIAGVLGVGVPELVAAGSDSAMTVVRATHEEQDAEGFTFRLLRRFKAGPCVIDFYDLHAREGEKQASEAHVPGVLEYLVVHAGELEITLEAGGSHGQQAVIGPGDYVGFTADSPHAYAAIAGELRATLLIHYAAETGVTPLPIEVAPDRAAVSK
jgi:transcriptional regulator with XRE-family HTH domain